MERKGTETKKEMATFIVEELGYADHLDSPVAKRLISRNTRMKRAYLENLYQKAINVYNERRKIFTVKVGEPYPPHK